MTMTTVIHKTGLGVSIAGAALAAIGALMHSPAIWQPGLVMFTAGFAAGAGYWPGLRSYQFTLWIIAGFVAAMTWSTDLIVWGGFNITHKWIVFLVIQATMFSMGTKLTIQDFIDVAKMPWAVFIGTFCHFVIMPLLGLTITLVFNFPPEVAVGILLIGACPSGLSSTVMVYIANANLALAVSIAAVSTLAVTVMTPLWVNLLAGSMIDIQLTAMVMDVGENRAHSYRRGDLTRLPENLRQHTRPSYCARTGRTRRPVAAVYELRRLEHAVRQRRRRSANVRRGCQLRGWRSRLGAVLQLAVRSR